MGLRAGSETKETPISSDPTGREPGFRTQGVYTRVRVRETWGPFHYWTLFLDLRLDLSMRIIVVEASITDHLRDYILYLEKYKAV